jgi:ribonucleotide reductase beta subunit family protein with ferritin-like domain
MPGLTFSNELISRDESLHTEFAILLFHHFKNDNNFDNNKIIQMVTEAVELEKEFATYSLEKNLIGMNSGLMGQYIEYVGDRLLVQLGFEKKWNVANPFDFMELISISSKTNFFESRVSQYSKAGVSTSMTSKQSFEVLDDF